jgi:S-adenosylmethionine:tRNA ribosyltransferase-isomerase
VALRTSDFDYPLDSALIAQQPSARRDRSRLLVLRRCDGQMSDRVFSDLPELLRSGDLVVINDTAVIPARFSCRRSGGGRIDGLFCREESIGRWEVMLRNAGRCRRGETLRVEGFSDVVMEMSKNLGGGQYELAVSPAAPAMDLLRQFGRTPLPPYIRRREHQANRPDRRRYQTVYAAHPGAVAAPTAGLHFTATLLRKLTSKGIHTAAVTLHVGVGTFAPVKVEDLTRHRMHAEWYELPAATARAVQAARREGRRIVAVGTTSLRVLETVAGGGESEKNLAPRSGWTDLFVYPPYRFRLVDALITNFHLPRSTLLMLVAAFCSPGDEKGLEKILAAYAHAAAAGYRFYSYGDAMLIE